VSAVDELVDVLDGRRVGGALGADLHGLVHELAGQRDDRPGHGGREEHRLAVGRQHREQLLDVRQETEIEHLVGFVQHEDLDGAEREMPLLSEVEQPARGADDHVYAAAQRVDLWFVGPAAVDGHHLCPKPSAGGGEVAGHLHRQFASRGDDERLRCRAARRGQLEPVEERDAETESLSGAGARLADQVGAAEGDRQGHLLDREGAGDADRGEGIDDLGLDVERAERRAVRLDRRVRGQRFQLLGRLDADVGERVQPGGRGHGRAVLI
jgi:hypothetical protein